MSGRFTFTAGNTLNAAQLNTNVMDGIPYRMITGIVTVTGSLAITFPVSFTTGVVPVMLVTPASVSNVLTSATINTPSATGTTIYTWTGTSASTNGRAIHYLAIQMTSTSGTGNS
jgi:hypothetical protein